MLRIPWYCPFLLPAYWASGMRFLYRSSVQNEGLARSVYNQRLGFCRMGWVIWGCVRGEWALIDFLYDVVVGDVLTFVVGIFNESLRVFEKYTFLDD